MTSEAFTISDYSPLSLLHPVLTLTLLTWTKWRAPTNASKWRVGFNSAFKGLTNPKHLSVAKIIKRLCSFCDWTIFSRIWHSLWLPFLILDSHLRKCYSFSYMKYCNRIKFRTIPLRIKYAVAVLGMRLWWRPGKPAVVMRLIKYKCWQWSLTLHGTTRTTKEISNSRDFKKMYVCNYEVILGCLSTETSGDRAFPTRIKVLILEVSKSRKQLPSSELMVTLDSQKYH